MAQGKLKVHGGDFPSSGGHRFIGGFRPKLLMVNPKRFLRETVKPGDIAAIEIATEESVKRVGGTVGWGLAGAAALGPLGMVAGLISGGKGQDITFVCKLNDGRKFMATTTSKIYKELAGCLLYTSPSPRDQRGSRMPSSA